MPSNFLFYAVPHNNHYTLLLESLYRVLQQVFEQVTFITSPLHPMPCSKPSFLNVTILHYNVFTKAVYNETSNWHLVG
jgi:hypothetical protein